MVVVLLWLHFVLCVVGTLDSSIMLRREFRIELVSVECKEILHVFTYHLLSVLHNNVSTSLFVFLLLNCFAAISLS